MSRLRRWLRALGRRVQGDMPDEMAAIHEAKAVARALQSFPEALGSPDAWPLRNGRVQRFNGRWYAVATPHQKTVLQRGEQAAYRIRDAVAAECERHRVAVRVMRSPSTGPRILV